MPTVLELNRNLLTLKGEVEVLKEVIRYLDAEFMPAQGGPPRMLLTIEGTSDTVGPEIIGNYINMLNEQARERQARIDNINNLPVADPGQPVREQPASQEQPPRRSRRQGSAS